MFLPKSRQLSAIGKEGIYLEDQLHHTDDRFSLHSSSDPYAPSFYHFKPNKPSIMPSTHIHNHRSTSTSYKDNSRAESPAYRGGNSYTGLKLFWNFLGDFLKLRIGDFYILYFI